MAYGRKKPAKCVDTKILSHLNGVKDVSFGPASIEARRRRDFSKTGKATEARTEPEYDDERSRAEMFGGLF